MSNSYTDSKKRKSSISSNNSSEEGTMVKADQKKTKKPKVTVKEEYNVEISSDGSIVSSMPSDISSSVVSIDDKNGPSVSSSLVVHRPIANRFDPFYPSYVQCSIQDPMCASPNAKYEFRRTVLPSAMPVMPMIPYYYHHFQFGVEACMHQLEQHRQQQAYKAQSTQIHPNGVVFSNRY